MDAAIETLRKFYDYSEGTMRRYLYNAQHIVRSAEYREFRYETMVMESFREGIDRRID